MRVSWTVFYSLLLVSLCWPAQAKIGSQGRLQPQRQRRSLEESSYDVVQQLNKLTTGGTFGAMQIPHISRHVHRIAMDGATLDPLTGEYDANSRHRARKILELAKDQVKSDSMASIKEAHQMLRRSDQHNNVQRRLVGDTAWLLLFGVFLAFLIVMAVTNIVAGSMDFPILTGTNKYINGVPGGSYDTIYPCWRLPLSKTETYGYLPITSGLTGKISQYTLMEVMEVRGILVTKNKSSNEGEYKEGSST